MTPANPPVLRLREMEPGQRGDFFALLIERARGATRDGKPFYTCRFKDGPRVATFMVWSDSPWFEDCEQNWKEGQFYKLRAVYQEHRQYGPQVDVTMLRPVIEADVEQGFDPLEFVESSRFHPDEMYAELVQLVEDRVGDAPLRRLTLTVLDRHADRLKRLPATGSRFYTFLGGLLEHTLSVTRSCAFLVEQYRKHYPDLRPPLNVDLVIAAAALHDVGRVLEFEETWSAVEPTVPGRLLGHLFLGRDLVRDTARELGDVNPELLALLEHMIVSHLNLPEWGSPRLPLIPESLILHHADDLDAKLQMYAHCLTHDQSEGAFTDRDPALGRQLLKGRTV